MRHESVVPFRSDGVVLSMRSLFRGSPHAVSGSVDEANCPTGANPSNGERQICLGTTEVSREVEHPPAGTSTARDNHPSGRSQ